MSSRQPIKIGGKSKSIRYLLWLLLIGMCLGRGISTGTAIGAATTINNGI